MFFQAVVVTLCLGLSGEVTPPTRLESGQGCASTNCHGGFAKKTFVHGPLVEGACDACHEQADETKHVFEFAAQGAARCVDCHDETLESIKHLHGPVGAGDCTVCHDPHSSMHEKLLLKPAEQLCVACHTDRQEMIEDAEHVHEPAKAQCMACHKPHGGATAMMLTASVPELCLECHDDMADQLDDALVTHGVAVSGKACLSCHHAHESEIEKLLIVEPEKLCMSCHDKDIKLESRTLPSMAVHLKDNLQHHGPVQEKDCMACHNPHASGFVSLVASAYPQKFYASYDEEAYELCFACHDLEAFEESETDEATQFRNGERNLHYLHVNKSGKGRSCRACHDVHATIQPHHIATSVPFGQWRIPLNYQTFENGGSCQPGCHKSYRYDREEPVENIIAIEAEAPPTNNQPTGKKSEASANPK